MKPNTLSVFSRQWELRMAITLKEEKKKRLNCDDYFHHFVTFIKLEIWKCFHISFLLKSILLVFNITYNDVNAEGIFKIIFICLFISFLLSLFFF